MPKPLLSFSQAAKLTGYAEATLRRWYRAGDLPAGIVVELNHRYYVRRAALNAWLAQSDVDTAEDDRQPALRAVGGGK